MSHVLVRFNEDGHEQEMVVPSNWLKGKILFYPNSIKTGDKETCDNYEFAISCDESLLSQKKGSVTNGAVRKPVPCIPVQNQSRKRNKEVCTDESDEEDFNVFPSKSKLKQVLFSDSDSSVEESSNVKLDQVRTKSKFSAEAPRNLCKIKCARDKFPMEGEWQYSMYKMLTEIKDIITTGNQDSRIVKSSDVNITKMNSVEDVNDFNKELVNLVTYEKIVTTLVKIGGTSLREITVAIMSRLLTNNCMRFFSMKGRKGKLPFEDLLLYNLICDTVLRSASLQKMLASK